MTPSNPMRAPIRIVLVEDQAMVLGALAALLEMEDDIEVVGRGSSAEAGLEAVRKWQPDVLLTDIEMPASAAATARLVSGLDLAKTVLDDIEPPPGVVILTTFARPGYLRRALELGVRGYLLKDTPSDQLADAIRRVASGGRVIDPDLAAEAWGAVDPLSERERQVLQLAGQGWSTGRMAEHLHLSEGTVRNYLSEAIGKTGAVNRTEAARIARQRGWL